MLYSIHYIDVLHVSAGKSKDYICTMAPNTHVAPQMLLQLSFCTCGRGHVCRNMPSDRCCWCWLITTANSEQKLEQWLHFLFLTSRARWHVVKTQTNAREGSYLAQWFHEWQKGEWIGCKTHVYSHRLFNPRDQSWKKLCVVTLSLPASDVDMCRTQGPEQTRTKGWGEKIHDLGS